MITIPCHPADPDPWAVFDELRPPTQGLDMLTGNLHRYGHDPDGYVAYFHFAPEEFGGITPGDGYWLWLFEETTICYPAQCSGAPELIAFPHDGWYMIGSPHAGDSHIDDTLWHQGATGPFVFGAISNTWVQDPLFGYQCFPAGYFTCGLLPTDDDSYLRAFNGYWMYAIVPDLTVEVPPPVIPD
jgi:hypothetical protein